MRTSEAKFEFRKIIHLKRTK